MNGNENENNTTYVCYDSDPQKFSSNLNNSLNNPTCDFSTLQQENVTNTHEKELISVENLQWLQTYYKNDIDLYNNHCLRN
jgi:hypothetical protein